MLYVVTCITNFRNLAAFGSLEIQEDKNFNSVIDLIFLPVKLYIIKGNNWVLIIPCTFICKQKEFVL